MGVSFEGYYSKYRLPSGASIALIISTVPSVAPDRSTPISDIAGSAESLLTGKSRIRGAPYVVTFAYVSADGRGWYRKEWTPEMMDQKAYGRDKRGFDITWQEGRFTWDGEDVITWNLDYPEVRFDSRTGPSAEPTSFTGARPLRVPWNPSSSDSTPAGILADFPLPIQWHVHSLDSSCTFTLDLMPGQSADPAREPPQPASDKSGLANVHIEKNWALSFPSAYTWIQARNHHDHSGICLAGGSLIPGVQAFLVGYQSRSGRWITFVPPTSTSVFSISLGMRSEISYVHRRAIVDIRGWFTRLKITAISPEGTFFPLSAPLKTGHAEGFSAQSFAASIKVEVFSRTWTGGWRLLEREGEAYEGGSLEFGGDYYKAHDE